MEGVVERRFSRAIASEIKERSATSKSGAKGRSPPERCRTLVRSITKTRGSFLRDQSSWP
jgi:hypothetical protein